MVNGMPPQHPYYPAAAAYQPSYPAPVPPLPPQPQPLPPPYAIPPPLPPVVPPTMPPQYPLPPSQAPAPAPSPVAVSTLPPAPVPAPVMPQVGFSGSCVKIQNPQKKTPPLTTYHLQKKKKDSYADSSTSTFPNFGNSTIQSSAPSYSC